MNEISAYFRCFIDNHEQRNSFPRFTPSISGSIELVFDTETKTDDSKDLIFGSCGIWINKKLYKFYIFYNDNLKKTEIEKIQKICLKYNVTVISRKEFVDTVFHPYIFKARAKCIGFNLPFDLSRLAINDTYSRKHHNGFSFTLSKNKKNPNIVIKSIGSKSQFIEFTKPMRKKTEKKKPIYRGCFIDCKTLTFSLTNNSYSLEGALDDFECTLKKSEAKKHGIISEEYIKYNINDTLATYDLYRHAMKRYERYCLAKLESKLFSPASIGKGYLEKIGIKPFLKLNPDFPKDLLGYTMMTYYGGKTETKIRGVSIPVSYIDFTSMYPTIFVLLDMYRFLIAKKITYKDTTNDIQKFLDHITLEDINKQETWKNFTTICRVVPDDDILSVRSDYGHKNTTNIGINYLKSTDETSIWYTLPDVMASKLKSGKTPVISEAITFVPESIQEGLQDIEVLKGITVKKNEDFIKKIIEERLRIKRESKNQTEEEQKQSEINQNILKIIANATSYGIFIQLDPKYKKNQKVTVHGLETFDLELDKTEEPALYFNPIMAVFLTAGSRLILAAAETLVEKNGGYIAYCDTDSIFVSPEHVKLVQEFFKPLNPYNEDVEMFKIETEKETKKVLHDVKCIAISAKRHVLYDYDETTGKITIYKYSLHGLGHLKGIDGKQIWEDLIMIHHHPERRQEILSKYKNKRAISQITITNYSTLQRFDVINKTRPYSKKIKPYNFATVGTACRADPDTKEPIIPFLSEMGKDKHDEIPFMEFLDYKTGKMYPHDGSLEPQDYWKDLESVLGDYIDHPESKLEGDSGVLKRRHLTINRDSIRYIGKESNELEESEVVGVSKENTVEYVNQQKKIRKIIESLTLEQALEIGISRRTFFDWKMKIRNNVSFTVKKRTLRKLLKL
ncbi:MAG: hypothetical protein ACREBB_11205 [Nitrosotalea sp.]